MKTWNHVWGLELPRELFETAQKEAQYCDWECRDALDFCVQLLRFERDRLVNEEPYATKTIEGFQSAIAYLNDIRDAIEED